MKERRKKKKKKQKKTNNIFQYTTSKKFDKNCNQLKIMEIEIKSTKWNLSTVSLHIKCIHIG